MKNCGGCWYWRERGITTGVCKLTELQASDDEGEDCRAHRPRELGEPCGVWVDVPELLDGVFCNPKCEFSYMTSLKTLLCRRNYHIAVLPKGTIPGDGCPRFKKEGS